MTIMIDTALIEKCADPSLAPAIVEQFLAAAGSDDPLAISVESGGRIVLIPKPADPVAALETIQSYVGQASVRVGITQYPAGVGVSETAQLSPDMFDACSNLRMGTALFAKVARIVTKWYGRPTNKEVLPQMIDDTVYAWRTGVFEGTRVFQAEDPGGPTFMSAPNEPNHPVVLDRSSSPGRDQQKTDDANQAGIRVDLSHIGVK